MNERQFIIGVVAIVLFATAIVAVLKGCGGV